MCFLFAHRPGRPTGVAVVAGAGLTRVDPAAERAAVAPTAASATAASLCRHG